MESAIPLATVRISPADKDFGVEANYNNQFYI